MAHNFELNIHNNLLTKCILKSNKQIKFNLLVFLGIFIISQFDIISQDKINNDNTEFLNSKINEYKFGLNFKYNNFVHKLRFNEFLSTNRPDFEFNNYTDKALQPELFVEYKLSDFLNIGMNFSYLKFNYNDIIDEKFLVSNQGTPTLANIRTTSTANFSTFNLSPKVSINYENIALNGNFNVFFCLIQI